MTIDTWITDLIAKGGPWAFAAACLLGMWALIRRWVIVPDKNFVPREMYDAKLKECEDWKSIVQGYGESFRDAVNILEAMEPRSSLRKR